MTSSLKKCSQNPHPFILGQYITFFTVREDLPNTVLILELR